MFQSVLDTIPVRVFWKDLDSVYLGCNQLFAEDAGRARPQDLIGKTDHEMAWTDEAEMKACWESFMADEEWAEIKRITAAKHGSYVNGIEEFVLMPTDYSAAIGGNA